MFGAEAFPKVSTGTDLVTSSSNAMMTTNSPGTLSRMSPMESVQELFVSMADSLQAIVENTTQTNELLKGTDAQRRDASLDKTDTDEDGDEKPKGRSFGDRLKSLNPFKEGLGSNIPTFILALGTLLGLKLFGDKLIPSIAEFLKTIKEGKITEKITEIYKKIKEELQPILEGIKEGVILLIEGLTAVKDFVLDIKDYVMAFDTNNDGKLDPTEMEELKKDIITNAKDIIFGVFGTIMQSIGASFKLLTVASIATFFAKKSPGALIARGGTAAAVGGLGLMGTLGLVAFAAAGVYSLYDRIMFAIDDELGNAEVPDNIVDKTSNFLARFLGGEDSKGGIANALSNAGTFGLMGAVLGSVIPGIGTAAGFAVGSAVGAAFGLVGSDKILDGLPSMANFDTNSDKMASFLLNKPSKEQTDISGLEAKEADLMNDLKQYTANNNVLYMKKTEEKLKDIRKDIELAPQRKAAREAGESFRTVDNANQVIERLTGRMINDENELRNLMQMSISDRPENYDNQVNNLIASITKKGQLIKDKEIEKQDFLSTVGFEYKIPAIRNRIDDIVKSIDMRQPNAMGGAVIANNNNDNSTKINTKNETYVGSGVDVNNNKLDTMRLIHKNMGR